VEFILRIINPCTGSWSLYSALLFPVQGRGVYTPHYYSLYRVVEFILHIIIPCTGSWNFIPHVIIPCKRSWSDLLAVIWLTPRLQTVTVIRGLGICWRLPGWPCMNGQSEINYTIYQKAHLCLAFAYHHKRISEAVWRCHKGRLWLAWFSVCLTSIP